MGTEAMGTLTVGGQKVNVKADFGSDRVLFSGGRRGPVPYKDIQVLGTSKGRLKLMVDGALMEFEIGPNVDRIAKKIRKPPGRLDKLGVKKGMTAAVIEGDDKFLEELRTILPDAIEGRPPEPVDLLVLGIDSSDGLDAIATHARHINEEGGLWVVYPKGRKEVTEMQVLEAGRAAGLKDVKVMRFSESHTALKFVIPIAGRGRRDV